MVVSQKKYRYVANWKMSYNLNETLDYAARHYDAYEKLADTPSTTIVICPTTIALYPLGKIFGQSNIKLGAQDCSDHARGSFTGQTSAESIRATGASYCIIGHSERRRLCGETSAMIASKLEQLIDVHINPIICIGETLEENKAGKTLSALEEQLNPLLQIMNKKQALLSYTSVSIAYEPVWAIGSGLVPTHEHLETVYAWLLQKITKSGIQVQIQFLYGGSVTSKNIEQLKKMAFFDGFLVGGASLDFQEFEKIVQY